MKSWVLIAGALAIVSVAALADRAGAQGEETPTIKQVMTRLHKGANSPLAKLKNELKAESPSWETIQDRTKDFVILGAALAKNKPKRGDQASWKRLADTYFQDAKALDDAAKAKDKAGAEDAYKRLSASCKTCHSAHKGQ